MVIIKLNVELIPTDVRFFNDPNYNKKAVFIINNLHPLIIDDHQIITVKEYN